MIFPARRAGLLISKFAKASFKQISTKYQLIETVATPLSGRIWISSACRLIASIPKSLLQCVIAIITQTLDIIDHD